MQTLTVKTDSTSYNIDIGSDILPDASFFDGYSNVFFLIDENVDKRHGQRIKNIYNQDDKYFFLSVKSGEGSKSFENFQNLANRILELGLDRKSALVACGGGVTGDLTGFLASTLMRGVDFIQIPTTLLAQVDSSVGGKTAINVSQGKNLVGSFYQPKHVFIDLDFLKTLSKRVLRSGYAEVLKYGLIYDSDFFDWLNQSATNSLVSPEMIDKNPDHLRLAIYRSCEIKAEIVSQDEKEKGIRALLNLGHTFGHAFEALCGYDGRVEHGEAVLLGMSMAARFSNRIGKLSSSSLADIQSHYETYNLPWHYSEHFDEEIKFDAESFLKTMYKDKKVAQGSLVLILLTEIGQAYTEHNVDIDALNLFLQEEFR